MSKLRNLLQSPELIKLAQRERLKELISQVDRLEEGSEPELLQQHIAEILVTWDNQLDTAINCYQSILMKHQRHTKNGEKNG